MTTIDEWTDERSNFSNGDGAEMHGEQEFDPREGPIYYAAHEDAVYIYGQRITAQDVKEGRIVVVCVPEHQRVEVRFMDLCEPETVRIKPPTSAPRFRNPAMVGWDGHDLL